MSKVVPTRKKSISLNDSFGEILKSVQTNNSKDWTLLEKKKSLALFKSAIKKVPTYKEYISKKKVDTTKIKTHKDFETVPFSNKKEYLQASSWSDICVKDMFFKHGVTITSTSGSTGTPFYFPRTQEFDLQTALYYQLFLQSANIHKKEKVLVIDCFGMGVWIGGLITYQAFKFISENDRALSIVTPGVNKQEIIKILTILAKQYDTIVLCGYPPFIKDIIDESIAAGVDWKKFSVKVLFAAESFSESFRDYVATSLGIKNIYRDIANIYGTADLGTMAYETPIGTLLKRAALKNPLLFSKLFGQASRLPTLAQYLPEYISFEEVNGSLIATGGTVLPLVRYELGDSGGVFTYDEMVKRCKEAGFDFDTECKIAGIQDTLTKLPFVFVYERKDFSISFYGVLIYPEYIKRALLDFSSEYLSGKFTMVSKNDSHENQYLEINCEIKQGVVLGTLEKKNIIKNIEKLLMLSSAEYSQLVTSLGTRACPKVRFWKYGEESYFSMKGKHLWVKKG